MEYLILKTLNFNTATPNIYNYIVSAIYSLDIEDSNSLKTMLDWALKVSIMFLFSVKILEKHEVKSLAYHSIFLVSQLLTKSQIFKNLEKLQNNLSHLFGGVEDTSTTQLQRFIIFFE